MLTLDSLMTQQRVRKRKEFLEEKLKVTEVIFMVYSLTDTNRSNLATPTSLLLRQGHVGHLLSLSFLERPKN